MLAQLHRRWRDDSECVWDANALKQPSASLERERGGQSATNDTETYGEEPTTELSSRLGEAPDSEVATREVQ